MNKSQSQVRLIDVVAFDILDSGLDFDGSVINYYDLPDEDGRLQATIDNETLPEDSFTELMRRFPNRAVQSSRATMLNLWQLWNLARNELILGNHNVHRDLCEIALTYGPENLMLTILHNPVHQSAFSRRALESTDPEIVAAALHDPSLTFEEVEPFLASDVVEVWSAAVSHPAIPAELLVTITQGVSPDSRAVVLSNPSFPAEHLKQFVNDWETVRLAIATNPNCPETLLVDLLMRREFEPEILQAALLNPALATTFVEEVFAELPLDLQKVAIDRADLTSEFLDMLARKHVLTIDSEEKVTAWSRDFDTAQEMLVKITAHRNLSSNVIEFIHERVWDSLSETARTNVAIHLNTPEEILLSFCKEKVSVTAAGFEIREFHSEFGHALTNSSLDLTQIVGVMFDPTKTLPGFEWRMESLEKRYLAEIDFRLKTGATSGDWKSFRQICESIQNQTGMDYWDKFIDCDWDAAAPMCVYVIATLPRIRLSAKFWQNLEDNFEKYEKYALARLNPSERLFPVKDAINVVNNPFAPESIKKLFRKST